MNRIESVANVQVPEAHDGAVKALDTTESTAPVLTAAAITAAAAAAFAAGVASDAVESGSGSYAASTGQDPTGMSSGELLQRRTALLG
ncbi:hypothetical protein ACOQFL_17100 [Actinopolyspora sp. H202]|uniref:hypothetical protein n=1 Tax=Actinopolyspora sp. H202 TaxID=1500456 RepID=UPI003EE7623F